MQASDFIRPENVILDLSAPTKPKALQIIAKQAEAALAIPASVILDALLRRENLGSTGVGEGVAIPHAPVPGLAKPFGLLARLGKPVDFESIDDMPVDIVIVLLTPSHPARDHLNMLACAARHLRSPTVLHGIRAAKTVEQLYAAIATEV
jgi:PTS system nitrogen regulatory IIA component